MRSARAGLLDEPCGSHTPWGTMAPVIEPESIHIEFAAELWYWRGPAPFHYITVSEDGCELLRAVAPVVSYGWGVIPVRARIGRTTWDTSLFPRDGRYLVPVKDAVRHGEGLALGDVVAVVLAVRS